jgi:hypothetical protein
MNTIHNIHSVKKVPGILSGDKDGRFPVPNVLKSGSLNLLETSGPFTALPFDLLQSKVGRLTGLVTYCVGTTF